jgi:hypothetical protein
MATPALLHRYRFHVAISSLLVEAGGTRFSRSVLSLKSGKKINNEDGCDFVYSGNVLPTSSGLHLYCEDEYSTFLRKLGKIMLYYASSHPRR